MKKLIPLVVLLLICPATTIAKEKYESSFIEDLPALEKNSEDSNLLEWTGDNVNVLDYNSLHLPQPYIILSEKNKYRGLQPDQLKLFADRLDALFTTRFEEILDVVEQPGPGVLVMNLALTEVKMKKKRGLLGYTPGGALLHAATSQKKYEDLEQLAEKILLKDANLEIELVDGGTGELLAIRILTIEGKEKGREEKSWLGLRAELDDLIDRFSQNYQASLAAARAAQAEAAVEGM